MNPLDPHAPTINEDLDITKVEAIDPRSAEEDFGEEVDEQDQQTDWLQLAQEAFRFSTNWVDSNYRKRWEDSLRAFNNQHPLDSKYTSAAYAKRSNIFRPKIRSVIRKNEAAAAAAFFSNMDVVSIEAQNQADPAQVLSADIMKLILQYRLSNSQKGVPWFHVVLGGLQDAQKVGAVCARYYWEYEERNGQIVRDRPMVKLIPIENIRIDAAADWMDPVNTSPYIIELIPMYICDIRTKMGKVNPKTGETEWKQLSDGLLRQAVSASASSTQIARERGASDPRSPNGKPLKEYEVIWVQRHIHRRDGEDWEFYTLSDVAMLSQPKRLSEVVLHGQRDYVIGSAILETHSSLPASIAELGKGLQDQSNEIANQRLDNVKFVLNKRWLVARNRNVDVGSLVRNVPGGVTMADSPDDIKEVSWPDVTASSYQEQDRINADMDELLGNFSSGSVLTNRKVGETVGGMQMLNAPANMLVEYLLRTYVETFVEPLLRGIVKLEQCYETDQVVMSMAMQRSQLFQRFGQNQQLDGLLNQDLTIKVNVGMGATDPAAKLQKFMMGVTGYTQISMNAPPGMNVNEVGKEIFGHLGYQDGRRFMTTDDPEKQMLQQKLQQAMQQIQQLSKQAADKHEANVVKAITSDQKNKTDLVREQIKQHGENQRALATHARAIQEAHIMSQVKQQMSPSKSKKGK